MTMSLTAAEFIQSVPPAGVRQSKLEPFARELRLLKKKGYTLRQMRKYLEQNGIEVTSAAISAYLIKTARSR